MGDRERLEKAVAALEAQRAALGDAAVDLSVAALRKRIAALRSSALAGATSKHLAVLLCDLSRGPGLPSALRAELESAIQEKGGDARWREDAVLLGLWGAQAPRPDDPERSVQAALAIQKRARSHNERAGSGASIPLRIGLDAGPVLVGAREAAGQAVETAARLAARAPAGGALLSENTYKHVRGVFDVEVQEPLGVEGQAEPLGVVLLERAKPRAFRMPVRGVGNLETRTVGRDAELQVLQDAYRDAAEGGRTQVTLVTGEAGVGKSRLLYEFEKWLELLPESILFFKGRATPETGRNPNAIFRSLLAFRFEIRNSDGVERVREKFRAGMAPWLETPRADVVGHWLGFDFSSSDAVSGLLGSPSFRQQALADLCRVFRAVAERPAALFFEDVHWADDASLDLVAELASQVPDRKLLMVCLARPSLFERRKDWGADHPAFSRLDLAPLTEDQSRALVAEILRRVEHLPEALRELVVKSALGNPFTVEETILLLIDRGVIRAGPENWEVDADALARAQVPKTLKGILRARLDCLPPRERLLLQCASVVGRQFWGSAVAELSASEGGARRADGADASLLEIASERQLIFPAKSSSFEGSQEYYFKHAIVRDFVYETVLDRMRHAYHAGMARWLERNLADRQSEYLPIIAAHFESAGEPEKAAGYLLRAGRELVRVSAFRDAVATFERALYLLPEHDDAFLAVLLADLGDACRLLGDHATARRWLERAVDLARRTGDARAEVLSLNALARTAMIQGAYTEAKPHLADALALASRTGDREGAAKVLLNLADVSFRLGDAETSTSSGQQSLEIATDLKDAQGIAGAHRVLGFASMMRGDHEAAARHHAQGLEIFTTLGDRWGMATCLVNLGEVHRKMGRIDEAIAYWEKALPSFQEIGSRHGAAIAHLNMGSALAGCDGREERAFENLRRALEESMAIGAFPIALEGLVGVATLYAREGLQPMAARLLGTVVNHPSFNAEIGTYSDPLVKLLRKQLGGQALQALMDEGRGRDLGAAVEEVSRKTLTV